MTNEEAREIMSKVTFYWELGEQTLTQNQINEAIDLAIKALEQQPCEDCISRAEALKHSHIEYDDDGEGHRVIYVEDIENLSSVTPSYNSIKTELDCVSRQAVIQIIENKLNPCTDMFKCLEMSEIKEDVEHLPSVTTKTRWIPISERLPEVGSEVLVCFDFKGNRSVYISDFYGDGEFHGLDDEYLTPEGRKCRKAVAWMPLPQPYKEGEE